MSAEAIPLWLIFTVFGSSVLLFVILGWMAMRTGHVEQLSREEMAGIVDIQIARLTDMLEERNITLELDAKARAWLADKGYEPVYGARPLKRVIQRELQNPLAGLILEGKIADGDTVAVSAGPGGLIVNGEAIAADAA